MNNQEPSQKQPQISKSPTVQIVTDSKALNGGWHLFSAANLTWPLPKRWENISYKFTEETFDFRHHQNWTLMFKKCRSPQVRRAGMREEARLLTPSRTLALQSPQDRTRLEERLPRIALKLKIAAAANRNKYIWFVPPYEVVFQTSTWRYVTMETQRRPVRR